MQNNTDKHGQAPCFAAAASQGKRIGDGDSLIPKHGGYEHTKTWQLADLIHGVTVRFCDKYVDRRSRTHDQMVQAARSGCQNLQEGSVDSAVSKKIEMKLTGIARGSLKELERDFKKFLMHSSHWPPNGGPGRCLRKGRRLHGTTLQAPDAASEPGERLNMANQTVLFFHAMGRCFMHPPRGRGPVAAAPPWRIT